MADEIPIEVNDSAAPGLTGVAVRQAILILAGWAAGKGYVDGSTAKMIEAVVPLVLTLGWGQYVQWRSHRDKRALAISAPIGTLK